MQKGFAKLVPAALFGLALGAAPAFADSIRLANGDTLSGEVVSLDGESLTLKSELLGELTVPRAKVAVIQLGDAPLAAAPTPAPMPQAAPVPGTPAAPGVGLGPGTAEENRLDAILGQLKSRGVSPQEMQDLEQQLPLLNQPEVREFFQERVGGLMTGRLNVQDIRKDAVDALEMIDDLEQELGPQGAEALKGYRGILENFVRRSAPGLDEEVRPAPGLTPEDARKADEAREAEGSAGEAEELSPSRPE